MKITVTPICAHPDHGFSDSGQPYVGQYAIIGSEGVWLNGENVIQRDRRMKKNREPGHPWIAEGGGLWTGFRVDVEP